MTSCQEIKKLPSSASGRAYKVYEAAAYATASLVQSAFDSFNGATVCTSAAIDASVCVNNILAIAFSNSANGATLCTSAAGDAIIVNYKCHFLDLPL